LNIHHASTRNPVILERGAAARLPEILGDLGGSFAVIADAAASTSHPEVAAALGSLGETIILEPGESQKRFGTVESVLDSLVARRIRRTDTIIAFGGGVTTDIAGFVSSIYLRGVRCVFVPTTLLGQVDAAIGGKNGVNLAGGKNLAGTFYEPWMLVVDPALLDTLPQAEYLSGLAEVVKYGLSIDPELLELIETSAESVLVRQPAVLDRMIKRSVEIKRDIVGKDPQESGPRMVLNYGHTFGHALEASGGYSRHRHGEAISVGMVVAALISRDTGLLDTEGVETHTRVLQRLGLPTSAAFDRDELMQLMTADKKFGASQRWVLLEQIGKCAIKDDVPGSVVMQALEGVQG